MRQTLSFLHQVKALTLGQSAISEVTHCVDKRMCHGGRTTQPCGGRDTGAETNQQVTFGNTEGAQASAECSGDGGKALRQLVDVNDLAVHGKQDGRILHTVNPRHRAQRCHRQRDSRLAIDDRVLAQQNRLGMPFTECGTLFIGQGIELPGLQFLGLVEAEVVDAGVFYAGHEATHPFPKPTVRQPAPLRGHGYPAHPQCRNRTWRTSPHQHPRRG